MSAVKEAIEVREGRRGDPLDSSVTLRRLKSMGALTLDQFGNPIFTGGGSVTVTEPGGGSGSGGYTPDLTPPPMPSGLTATAGFACIFVEWNGPAYTAGHGNAYTEVWAANRPAGGPDPTFSSAVFVGSTAGTGGFFSDSVPYLGVQRHYWVRHVTNDGVAGPYAGGTNGASAATGKVGRVDLAPLIIDASKLADGAVDFGGSKVTGTITDPARFGTAVIGSAAIQNLAVQNQHVGSLSASKLTAGTIDANVITVNNLNAAKITVGQLVRTQLGSESATVIRSAASPAGGWSDYPAANTWVDVLTVAIDTTGCTSVVILVGVTMRGSGGSGTFGGRVVRDGSLVGTPIYSLLGTPIAFPVATLDTAPAAGVHTYRFQMMASVDGAYISVPGFVLCVMGSR